VIRTQRAEASDLSGFKLDRGMADAEAFAKLGAFLGQQGFMSGAIRADEMRGQGALRGAQT
jgi:hypothetical protein